MNKTLSTFIAGLLIGALLATGGFALFLKSQRGGGSTSAQTVLKLGHGQDTKHPVHQSIEFMNKRLQELSGGTVTIDIYPSAVLGAEVQSIEQLQNGSLAMTCQSVAALENFIPSMATFSLPYVFRDAEHFWKVLDGDVGAELMQPIAWGELYSALAQGTVDGAENNPPSFFSNKHYEVCKHFSLDGHSRVPDTLLMSSKVWDQLSPQVQQWVAQAASESSEFQRELWRKDTERALEQAAAEGVEIYKVDTASFSKMVQPMLQSVENPDVKQLLKQIAEVK